MQFIKKKCQLPQQHRSVRISDFSAIFSCSSSANAFPAFPSSPPLSRQFPSNSGIDSEISQGFDIKRLLGTSERLCSMAIVAVAILPIRS